MCEKTEPSAERRAKRGAPLSIEFHTPVLHPYFDTHLLHQFSVAATIIVHRRLSTSFKAETFVGERSGLRALPLAKNFGKGSNFEVTFSDQGGMYSSLDCA